MTKERPISLVYFHLKIFKIHNLFSQINATLILPFRKDFLSASHFKNALKKITMNDSIKVRLEKKED